MVVMTVFWHPLIMIACLTSKGGSCLHYYKGLPICYQEYACYSILHLHFMSQLTPYLEKVMQGIKIDQLHTSQPKKHLPIKTNITRQINQVLLQVPHSYHSIMIWAFVAQHSLVSCTTVSLSCPPSRHMTQQYSSQQKTQSSIAQALYQQSNLPPSSQTLTPFAKGQTSTWGKQKQTQHKSPNVTHHLKSRSIQFFLLHITL